MKIRHHRKILRISTFLAVTLGLSIGSSAMAEEYNEAKPLTEIQLAQGTEDQEQDDGFFDTQDGPETQEQRDQEEGVEGEPELAQEEDLPRSIENFREHVQEGYTEGVDDVFEYTHDGADQMAQALEEVIPDEDDRLSNSLDDWQDRLGSLQSSDRGELYPALTSQLFMEGADLVEEIQATAYPDQQMMVSDLRERAEAIDPNEPIQTQMEAVQNYFASGLTIIETMYLSGAQEPIEEQDEPVTRQQEGRLLYASLPGDLAQMDDTTPGEQQPGEPQPPADQEEEDDGFFDWGTDDEQAADIPGAVEDFDDFVTEHRDEGIDHVANYTREGSKNFHGAMEALVPEEDELIREQLARFEESVTALDDTPRAQYPATLRQTLTDGTQLLTTIQQAHYPQQEEQVRQLYSAVEEIDVNTPIENQVEVIQNFYLQANEATLSMGQFAPEEGFFSMKESGAIAQAGDGAIAGEHGEGYEEHDDEMMDDDIGGGPMVEGAVQNYVEFSQNLSEETFSENGEVQVIEGLRLLDEAIMVSIENGQQDPGMQEPGMEEPGMEEPGMEDPDVQPMQATDDWSDDDWDEPGPGMEEPGADPSMEDQDQLEARADVNDKRLELREKINDLEASMGSDDFNDRLEDTLESAVEVFTTMQESEEFNVAEAQVDTIKDLVDDFDSDTGLDEQAALLVNFFQSSGDIIENVQDPELQVMK